MTQHNTSTFSSVKGIGPIQSLLLPKLIFPRMCATGEFTLGICVTSQLCWGHVSDISPKCLVDGFLENTELVRGIHLPNRSSCLFYPVFQSLGQKKKGSCGMFKKRYFLYSLCLIAKKNCTAASLRRLY